MNSSEIIAQRRAKPLFVTETDIKTLTPLSANKVTTSIIQFILVAQDMQIKKILGETLYNKLMSEWIVANYDKNQLPDGTGTIPPIIVGDTTNYVELYDMIYKPLVWWSYIIALPYIAIKVEEAGIMLNQTSYSESSGLVGLDRLKAEGEAIARQYTEYLNEYICTTFSSDTDVMGESKELYGPSLNIYSSKKPWNITKSGCCKKCIR